MGIGYDAPALACQGPRYLGKTQWQAPRHSIELALGKAIQRLVHGERRKPDIDAIQ